MLRSDAPGDGGSPETFKRRVFWIKEHDRSEQPDGVYKSDAPSEAVDPRTVTPGVWGGRTDRALGVPTPEEQGSVAATRKPSRKDRAEGPKRAGTAPPENAVDRQLEATAQGVTRAFADWLYLHDVSVPDTVAVAAGEAFSHWLWANSDELVAAIAEAVAKQASQPEPPTLGQGT